MKKTKLGQKLIHLQFYCNLKYWVLVSCRIKMVRSNKAKKFLGLFGYLCLFSMVDNLSSEDSVENLKNEIRNYKSMTIKVNENSNPAKISCCSICSSHN